LGRAVAIFWDVVAGEELCLDFSSELIIRIQKVGLLCASLFINYHTVKADHAQINIERASRPPGRFLSVKELVPEFLFAPFKITPGLWIREQ
jgi:hypothetical protein